ncbi:MAG: hypothetical protein OEY61_01835 [Gammaproteobacteria bacterium]|nr:hypothetical protein [Gammaproteobacteria bacterium]
MIKNVKKFVGICLFLLFTGLFAQLNAQDLEQNTTTAASSNQQIFTQAQTSVSGNQSITAKSPEAKRELSMFFKIGIALNIIMLTAYITWAVRQWRQSNNKKDQ